MEEEVFERRCSLSCLLLDETANSPGCLPSSLTRLTRLLSLLQTRPLEREIQNSKVALTTKVAGFPGLGHSLPYLDGSHKLRFNNQDDETRAIMGQRLTYRRRLPCITLANPLLILFRQHQLQPNSSHQNPWRKTKIFAHQEARQRSSMW